jgi:hypothetical protein
MTVLIVILIIIVLAMGVPLGYMLGIVSLAGLWDMGGWPFLRIIGAALFAMERWKTHKPFR